MRLPKKLHMPNLLRSTFGKSAFRRGSRNESRLPELQMAGCLFWFASTRQLAGSFQGGGAFGPRFHLRRHLVKGKRTNIPQHAASSSESSPS
jgi:hypothetical protein